MTEEEVKKLEKERAEKLRKRQEKIDNINNFFRKIKNFFSRSYTQCCYIYQTKNNKTMFFMHKNLTSFEKKINSNSLNKTEIKTIEQGKKLFFRFLKNYDVFVPYLSTLNKKHYSIDDIIQNEFITPFYRIYKSLDSSQPLYKVFVKLEVEWERFLKSIKYIT